MPHDAERPGVLEVCRRRVFELAQEEALPPDVGGVILATGSVLVNGAIDGILFSKPAEIPIVFKSPSGSMVR